MRLRGAKQHGTIDFMLCLFRSWAFGWGLLVIAVSGCASQPTPALPTPTVQLREAVITLPALLAEPQRWSGQQVVLVTPVRSGEAAQVLTLDDASNSADAIWLSQPLPESITSQLSNGSGVVRLRGRLSPPGAYGRNQEFSYQFSAQRTDLLQPERTTLANLATNPDALDRILLRLDGTLLVQRDAALLANEVSEGGVPTATARQIKLSRSTIDEQLVAQLNRSGEVRWGMVQVIGWWQDGVLTPFMITATAGASPATP